MAKPTVTIIGPGAIGGALAAAIVSGGGEPILVARTPFDRLHAYGGLGYDHLITNVVPRLRERGLSDEDVRTLIVGNPAQLFRIDAPA